MAKKASEQKKDRKVAEKKDRAAVKDGHVADEKTAQDASLGVVHTPQGKVYPVEPEPEETLDEAIADEPVETEDKDYTEVISSIKATEAEQDEDGQEPASDEQSLASSESEEVLGVAEHQTAPAYADKHAYAAEHKYTPYTSEQPADATQAYTADPAQPASHETGHEVEDKLKKQGYMIKDKFEHDIDEIRKTKEPNPTGDKEVDLAEKKGIPKYFGRKEEET